MKNQLPSNTTRTSRHPNCTFYDPLNVLKHKLLEQIRRCQCNEDCNVQLRFRKCFKCDQAEICQANYHPMNAGQEFEKCNRGIESEVKGIIEEYYKKNIRQVRPIDIFNWLNLEEKRSTIMDGLQQPKLHQIQYFVQKLRAKLGADESSNDIQTIIELIEQWSFENATNDQKAFFFGLEKDHDNKYKLNKVEDFRVALASKKLLSHFNHDSYPIFHIDNTYKCNKSRFPFLVFDCSDFSGQLHPISVSVMKREKAVDYVWFLTSLKELCLQKFDLNLEDIVSML